MSRRAFSLRRLLHLLCVAAGGVGLWLVLAALPLGASDTPGIEWLGREWSLREPRYLWGALLLPWIWLVPGFGLSDLPRWQQAVSALVRSALVALVLLGLSRLATVSREGRVAVAVLADVSESVPDSVLREAERFVRAVREAAPGGPLRLVTFAAQPREVQVPAEGEALARLVDGGPRTDLEAALKMAYGLFPPDHFKRVVLLSDGFQTDGDVLAEAASAGEAGVEVDFAVLEAPRPAEVLVRRVSVPESVELEAPFTLEAEVFATGEAGAVMTLWQGDYREAGPTRVALTAGLNRFELPVTVHEPGFRRFRLVLEPDEGTDRTPGNNEGQACAVVEGSPRVLYVEGDPRSATYLARALDKEQIDVEVRGPQGVPATLEELEDYDLLVLSDVSAIHLTARQMDVVVRYVRDTGGGFLMAGGEDSFGMGGWYGTPVEAILPVRLEVEKKRSAPTLALALLIDKSGSMTGEKIELAKDAAAATVELLSKDDQVAVLAFDAAVQPLVRLQSARNRVRILSQITRLAAGGGTELRPVLDEAYRQLQPAEARLKHVILLSDGQSERAGIPELVSEMAADGITITTVAVGNGADRTLLNEVSERGGGRSYFTNDPFNIPKIFTKETTTVARNALVERPFRPVVRKQAQVFRGLRLDRAPYLLGYVSTRAKRGAEVLLESESGEPIFARWRQGLGTVAVWTSDLKNRWAVEWVRWRGWGKLWSQVARDLMRQTDTDGLELHVEVTPEGGGRIVLDAVDQEDRWRNGLEPVAEVVDPSGGETKVALRQTAAGRYEAALELPRHGSYLVRARPSRAAKRTSALKASLAYPYAPEYLTVGNNRPLLERLASATGGRADVAPAAAWDAAGRTLRFTRELRTEVFLLALALFVLDLLLRRVRLGRAREVPFV